jgi:transposase InsO family protein
MISRITRATEKYRMLMPRIGGRKLYYLLKKENEEVMKGVGRDKYFAVLREKGLLTKRKRKTRNLYSNAVDQIGIKNLKKETTVERRNHILESDLTMLYTQREQLSLAICMDVYSRKIVGWHLDKKMRSEEAIKALHMASQGKEEELNGSIHHSDQGCQFCSKEYRLEIEKLGMKISLSKRGTPTDAAYIERINNTLKNEFNLKKYFQDYSHAKKAVLLAIMIYNNVRPHMSLGYKTPSMVYEEKESTNKLTPFGLRPSGVNL